MVDGERSIDGFEISNSVLFTFNLFRLTVFTDMVRIVQIVSVTFDAGLSQLQQDTNNTNYNPVLR